MMTATASSVLSSPSPDRRLRWVSSIDPANHPALETLQVQLAEFYSRNPNYYPALKRSADWWKGDPYYDLIVSELRKSSGTILEAGCGRSHVLRHFPEFASRYTGFDFSPDVMAANQRDIPDADFRTIENPREFPVPSASYDVVFSVWVLEHCPFPQDFLNECIRVLRPGGRLIVLTPDFLGGGLIPSQRCGGSEGAARAKWDRGQRADALLTAYDQKIRIPLHCAKLRRRARQSPGFYINLRPACFTDAFQPDVDAVYVTFRDEIRAYLGDKIAWEAEPPSIPGRHVIYLAGTDKR